MHCTVQISEDLFWVGGSDRRLALFENVYPIARGVSYNAYVVLDEQTVLLDTTDAAIGAQFLDNVDHVLGGRKLDWIIVNHLEPDHAATLAEVSRRHPQARIVLNDKAVAMAVQFFGNEISQRFHVVKEGDMLSTGRHAFHFVMAPMVHWPEVMVTYDVTDKVLFSADAFGAFGALNGVMFADEVNFERDWLDDARRYYTNIVGKYGAPVQALLKKASALDISMICPLHGPIWRENIGWFVDKYQQWSTYTPESDGVLIAYASVYGHTQLAAEKLAFALRNLGVRDIAMYDVSVTHPSYIVSDAFRLSKWALLSATYNAGIFPPMETLLMDLKAHALKNRTVAVVDNGSWAPVAGKLMRDVLSTMKVNVLEDKLSIRSALDEKAEADLQAIAKALVEA